MSEQKQYEHPEQLGNVVMIGDEIFAGIDESDIQPINWAMVIEFKSKSELVAAYSGYLLTADTMKEMVDELESLRAQLQKYKDAEKQEPIAWVYPRRFGSGVTLSQSEWEAKREKSIACATFDDDGHDESQWYSLCKYPAPIPEGYVPAPKEPTSKMCESGNQVIERKYFSAECVYKEMIAAAEQTP